MDEDRESGREGVVTRNPGVVDGPSDDGGNGGGTREAASGDAARGDAARSAAAVDGGDPVIEVPGPEDAWLRGGTVVPEGSSTEASTGGRPPLPLDEDGLRGGKRKSEGPPRGTDPRPSRDRAGRRAPGPDGPRRGPGESRPPADGSRGAASRPARSREGGEAPPFRAGGREGREPGRPPAAGGPSRSQQGAGEAAGRRPGRPEPRRPEPRRQRPPRQGGGETPLSFRDVPIPGDDDGGESDPWKRALALFSRIGQDEGSAGVEDGERVEETKSGEARAAEAKTGKGPAAGEDRPGEPAAPVSGNGRADTGAPRTPRPGERPEDLRRSRPVRSIYTLQDVHERTGIPYATLALYAVSHRERIPWVGERHSPAYPREGLEEFCRIHEEKNPGWQRPAEGTEKGWDDETALAARLEMLQEEQDRLSADLRSVLAEVRRTWTGEAEWVEA